MISDHCVSRSVRDSTTWLAITERADPVGPLVPVGRVTEPPGRRLRIGVYHRTGFGDPPDADVSEALAGTTRLCESLGHEVVETTGPQFDAQATSDAFFTLAALAVSAACEQVRGYMGQAFDEARLEPSTRELLRYAKRLPATASKEAVGALERASASADRRMAEFDLLLCPTVAFPAFLLGHHGGTEPFERAVAFTEALAGYTAIASIAE